MDIEITKRYYARLTDAELCDCAYCRNYIREIRRAYPKLTAFLDSFGVDIEKPFEAMPVAPCDGTMTYSGVQYVVMGAPNDFRETSIENVRVFLAESHPMTDIQEQHFVIEIAPVYLKWTGESHGVDTLI